MPLTATVRAGIKAEHTKALDLGTASFDLTELVDFGLTSGTGAGAADLMFTDTRTLAASGTENLDLAGSLTDAFGATLTFVELRAVVIKASPGNTNNVEVTTPAAVPRRRRRDPRPARRRVPVGLPGRRQGHRHPQHRRPAHRHQQRGHHGRDV
jgi:hypothetical protein